MAEGTISFSKNYTLDTNHLIAGEIGSATLTDTSDGFAILGSEPVTTSGSMTINVNIIRYNTSTNGDVMVHDTFMGTYFLLSNNTYVVDGSVNADTLTPETSAAYTYCFLTGTQIATPTGAVAVEDLQVGDQVLTHDGKTATVRFNFIQQKHNHIFANKEDLFPICIKANALADNVPSRDLYVSPDHAIYFPEWKFFAEAHTLRNGTSIYQVQQMPETFTYYHVLCSNQEIVLAENTPAETFIDNVSMETFDNYANYLKAYPDAEDHEMQEIDRPRAKSPRQLPRQFKQNLLDRAQMLYPVAQAA